MSDYSKSAARFARNTASHRMTVLHDDGLYRHLRFTNPDSSLYWYEITTTPGQLVFSGDGDTFAFRVAPDMFEMFRRSAESGGINPQYWAEKCRTGNAYTYSRDRFEEYVEKQVVSNEPFYPGLRDDVRDEIFDSPVYDVDHEPAAVMTVLGYEFHLPLGQNPDRRGPFRFSYVHAWELKDFDWWFLFACHAISDAIVKYDAARKAVAA
ncbi:hypothetical protein AB0D47_19930 [Streptomyces sp. NPDC048376]|uniref:hypothetical protein n=1 Tax=Streptomyces sp. NPDC048376 TaxID=3154926 RepID=UPI00341A87BA